MKLFKKIALAALMCAIIVCACSCGDAAQDATEPEHEQNVEEINAVVYRLDADTYGWAITGHYNTGRVYYACVVSDDGSFAGEMSISKKQYLALREGDEVVLQITRRSDHSVQYSLIIPD